MPVFPPPVVALRPASIADLPLLRHWDEQPHVVASDPNDDWQWETELDPPSGFLSPESSRALFSENILASGKASGMALSWFKRELAGHTDSHAGGGGGTMPKSGPAPSCSGEA